MARSARSLRAPSPPPATGIEPLLGVQLSALFQALAKAALFWPLCPPPALLASYIKKTGSSGESVCLSLRAPCPPLTQVRAHEFLRAQSTCTIRFAITCYPPTTYKVRARDPLGTPPPPGQQTPPTVSETSQTFASNNGSLFCSAVLPFQFSANLRPPPSALLATLEPRS
jgi:hypothetical protein